MRRSPFRLREGRPDGGLPNSLAGILAYLRLSPLSAMILAALTGATALSALFAVTALIWQGPQGAGSTTDWTPPRLEAPDLDPPKPVSADVEALTRPVFSKNRKPGPKSAAHDADPAAPASAPAGLVVGAIVKRNQDSQAFVVSTASPDGDWMKVGDAIEAWRIAEITAAEVVFENGEQKMRIQLYEDPPDPEAPPPLPPPQPGAPPPMSPSNTR